MNQNPKVSIILPFYNRWDLTHNRLYELYRHAPEYCEIILINDASTEVDCEAGVAWWQKVQTMLNPVRYKKNKENLGFGGSMNVGAQYAKGDILVFLSNDVVVHDDFFTDICNIIQKNSRVLIGGRIVDWMAGWNEIMYKGQKRIVPYCEGWLLACTKDTWNELGGFDPIYSPSDYEDVCLSTTAKYLGIPLVALNADKVKHLGGESFGYNPIREERTRKNRELWLKKWEGKWDAIFE